MFKYIWVSIASSRFGMAPRELTKNDQFLQEGKAPESL